MKIIILLLVVVLVIAFPAALAVSSIASVISFDPALKVIGYDTPVKIHLDNGHGFRVVKVTILQDAKSFPVSTIVQPAKRIVFKSTNKPSDLTVNVGKKETPELHDGAARITVETTANDFRAETDTKSIDVNVMTTPPHVSADGVQHYINVGGSEMATFTPTGAWTEAGVMVGDRKFRSFPLPDHPGEYFSLFAFAWNAPPSTPVYVYASNPAGAMAKTTFWYKVFPKKFRASTIPLETMNIDRIVGQIDTQNKIKGDMVDRFVTINNAMRKENNKVLEDLRFQSEPKFLWSGAFLPMVDSTVESRFADDRTYTWKGKKVDEQTHLGFDLAKLQHSPVPASNDGKVVWADDLGIYGNCIVIDHGFGLMSVYGHLSEFLVKKGDMVKKAQTIAKTGSTGLAGGDHLHFTMLVDGVQINPVEWWDPHWVKDRILSKMGLQMAGDQGTEKPEAAPAPKAHRPVHKKRR